MTDIYSEKIKTARFAGWLYLALAVTGAYGLMFVSSRTFVRGDAVATANNILANEFLYRTGIASTMISVILLLVLSLVLYKLLKEVHEQAAKLMVALVVVQVPINFLSGVFKIMSLMIMKGELLKGLDTAQVAEMSFMFTKLSGFSIAFVELFWGLWLLPLALLVYRCGFIPRLLGILVMLGGIGYTVDSLTFMVFPAFRAFTTPLAYLFSGLGEVGLILWLLIVGVKVQKATQTAVVA